MPIVFPQVEPWLATCFLVLAGILILLSFAIWVLGARKTLQVKSLPEPAPEEKSGGTTQVNDKPVTQNHWGSGHNISAQNVNIGPQPRHLTDKMRSLIEGLPYHEPITLIWVFGDKETEALANEIREYMEKVGRPPSRMMQSNRVLSPGVSVHHTGAYGLTVMVDQQG